MCLADRCSLVAFTESTLDMGSIGPLRDVTGHQLFSRRRQVEAKFEVPWTRLGPVVSNALHLRSQRDSKRGARILPSPSLCFLSSDLVDICDSILGFGGVCPGGASGFWF